MITKEKMEIFIRCDGSDDSFARTTSSKEIEMLSQDWKFINDLVFDLTMINKNLVSKEMKNKIEKLIEENLDSKDTKELLIKFAKSKS